MARRKFFWVYFNKTNVPTPNAFVHIPWAVSKTSEPSHLYLVWCFLKPKHKENLPKIYDTLNLKS